MQRNTFLWLLAATFLSSAIPALAKEKPNIIFIMADDLGQYDLGCPDP